MGPIIERVYGRSLDEVAQTELFGPLGMKRSTFTPLGTYKDSIAPTEIGPDGEIKGRVHDESSWAITASGGGGGGAGGRNSFVTSFVPGTRPMSEPRCEYADRSASADRAA